MAMNPGVANQMDALKRRALAMALSNMNSGPSRAPVGQMAGPPAPAPPVPASPNVNPAPAAPQSSMGSFTPPPGSMQTLAMRNMVFNQDLQNRQLQQDTVNNDRNFRINESGVTGKYLAPDAEAMASRIAALKSANVSATGADQKKIWDESNNLRNQWNMKGYDPNAIASGITADEMYKRIGAGSGTQQAKQQDFTNNLNTKQFNYGVGQDKIKNGQWQQEFTQRANQDGLQNAISWFNANTSRASQSNASGNESFNRLQDVWAATGKAPAGLESYGVKQGDPYKPEVAASLKPETADSMRTYFDSMIQRDDKGSITNTTALESSIMNSPVSDYDAYQLYLRYGLSWNGPIPSPN
jgi:hypothetical protein